MKLKNWRKKKKISQVALADGLGRYAGKRLPQNTISSWENGKMPRKFWLVAIAEYTKKAVMAEDFLRGE